MESYLSISCGQTQLVSFDHSNNLCANYVKIERKILQVQPAFKTRGLSLTSKNWI